jgi:hypothetical protein
MGAADGGQSAHEGVTGKPMAPQHRPGRPIHPVGHGQEQVLRADVFVAHGLGLPLRLTQRLGGGAGETDLASAVNLGPTGEVSLQLLDHDLRIGPRLAHHLRRHSVGLTEQGEQQVLVLNGGMPVFLRQPLRFQKGLLRFLRIPIQVHRSSSSSLNASLQSGL